MLSAKGAFDLSTIARGHKAPMKAAASNVIYSQDFNNELIGVNTMTIIDANNDGHTWDWYGNRARCAYDRVNAADDWMLTEAIHLEAGKLYSFAIKAQAYSDRYAERFEVKLGNAATAEAMTIQVIEPQVIKTETKQEYTNDHIIVPATGDYFFGVHGISDPDCMYLYVDDIIVAEGAEVSNPAKVDNLTITPDANGALKATIAFNAPTTQINGTALSAAMNIDIVRGAEVIKTFESVEPGVALSFVDETVPYAGEHTYTIKAKVGDNEGDALVVKAYVGLDIPAALQGVRAADKTRNIDFCFDPISSTGFHKGAVVPEDVTVDLYSVYYNDLSGGVSLEELLESSKTSPVSTKYNTNIGTQDITYWALIPWNEAGNGPTEWVPLFVGAPSAIPYFEGFKGHKFNNFWTYDISSASVVLNYTGNCSDEDGTGIVFNSVSDDEWGFIESGKINIKGAKAATISVDIMGDVEGNTVTIQAIGPDGKYVDVATLPVTKEYVTHGVSLVDFNQGDFVRVRVQADINKSGAVFIDNICVLNQLDKNLAVTDIEIEATPEIGSESEVLVTVTNYGKETIDNYTINLYANGEKVATQVGSYELEPMKNITEILSFVPSIFCTGSLVLTGEVIFDEDMDENDNRRSLTVDINKSQEDAPEGFGVSFVDGKAHLAWNKATDTPKVVTEDFENYTPWVIEPNEPFSTTTLGPWTLVNNDLSYAGYLWETIELPCEFQSFAYVVTNMDGIFGPDNEYPGHSGYQYLSSFYGFDIESLDMETGDMDFAEQNDWIISPELSGREQTISFWYQAPSPDMMMNEYFYIQTSTTDNKLDSFSPLNDELFAVKTSFEYDDWQEFTITLPEGTKYFAINRNDGPDDGMWFMIDDITYEKVKKLPVSYNVYLDHKLVATIAGDAVNYDVECNIDDLHDYSITAVYANGVESEPVSIVTNPAGISTVSMDGKASFRFNLAGQRISRNAKGVVIENGRKVVVK